MQDDQLPRELREAYQSADPEFKPSPFLRKRTLRALEQRGLVAPARPRRASALTAAVGVAAALAGFLVGVAVSDRSLTGTEGAWESPATMAASWSIESALEEVQRTGTAHYRALERLVDRLDQVDASTLAEAQQVYMAAQRAGAEYSEVLLAGRTAATAPLPAGSSGRASNPSLIWF